MQVLERFTRQLDFALKVGLLGFALELFPAQGDLREPILKFEFVLGGLSHSGQTPPQDGLFLRIQLTQAVCEFLLSVQPCLAGFLVADVALSLVQVDDLLPVLQEARFHIGQPLQLLDVALNLGHGRSSERARGRVVVELRFSGFTGRFGLATVDGVEPFLDRIGQERHLPQVNIGLVGLLDDCIAFFQCGLEGCLVLFGERVQPLATSEEGAEQLDVGPDRLEAAHDRLGHLDHTSQGIDHDGNAVGRVLRPGLERPVISQLDHSIGRVVGAQHHGFELANQLFKGWERRCHDGLGHKIVLGPHPAQRLGGFFGRFDLGLGEPDVEILVGSQILEEGQQPCT